jgi:hypothetical protein
MTDQAVSPLRRRMIEDMTIRKFGQKTQHEYAGRDKCVGGKDHLWSSLWAKVAFGLTDWTM